MSTLRIAVVAMVLAAFAVADLYAGGPWVQKPGKVRLTFGFSRKTANSLWRNGVLEEPHDSTLVDGLFHDFQYGYLYGEVGIIEGLELSGTINYLWGYERIRTDPQTGKAIKPAWELNQGFTDSWLNLKYQVLGGDFPVAVMLSSRFPDLYDEPGHVYDRYNRKVMRYSIDSVKADGTDTICNVIDTVVEASGEWRGLLKRDLGVFVLAGHSFGDDGYIQAQLGYNFREDAFADQVMFSIDGGYNFPVTKSLDVMPKLLFDYTGGVGNGEVPNPSDRFGFKDSKGRYVANNYFNNGRYGRLYGSVTASVDDTYGIDLGVGRWIFGNGSARYWETYAQVSYQF